MILLANLPHEHQLRNTPLGDLDACYRWKGSTGAWRTVKTGAPKLVGVTYNELGTSWTLFDDWSVEDES